MGAAVKKTGGAISDAYDSKAGWLLPGGAAYKGGKAAVGAVKSFVEGNKPAPIGAAPVPPDLTEEALRKARAAEMLRVLSRRGRASTMLTGPQGDTSTPNTRKTMLTGG